MTRLLALVLVTSFPVAASAQDVEPDAAPDKAAAAPTAPAPPPPDPTPTPAAAPTPPPSDANTTKLSLSGPPVSILVTLEASDPGVQDMVTRVEGALTSALGRDGRFAPVTVDFGGGEPPKEDLSEAQKHITAAKAAYDGLDLDGAVKEYAEAIKFYLAHPFSADPKSLAETFIAWGATYQLNGDKAHADGAFRFAIALSPDLAPDKAAYGPDILAEYLAQKNALEKAQNDSPSTLTLDLEGAPHAEVSIDGHVIGHAPLRGYKLMPGRHFLVAKEPGFNALGQVVSTTAGDDTPLKLALEETETHKALAGALTRARADFLQPAPGPGSLEASQAAKAQLVVIGKLSSGDHGTQIDLVLEEPGKHRRLAGVSRQALVESRQFPSVMDDMARELGNDYIDPPDSPFGDDGTGSKPIVKRWYFWAGVGVAVVAAGAAAYEVHQASEPRGLGGGTGFALGLH